MTLTRQREQHLVQQQEEQGESIPLLFPPDVAKVLVKKKKKDLRTSSNDLGIKHNPSLFRTVGNSMKGWLICSLDTDIIYSIQLWVCHFGGVHHPLH